MGTTILGIIGSLLLCIIGVWKYFGRVNTEKRKLADEAKSELDKANKNGNESDFLDAFGNANRANR